METGTVLDSLYCENDLGFDIRRITSAQSKHHRQVGRMNDLLRMIKTSVLCMVTTDESLLQKTELVPCNKVLSVTRLKTPKPVLRASEMFCPGHWYELQVMNGKYVIPVGNDLLVIPNSVVEPVC